MLIIRILEISLIRTKGFVSGSYFGTGLIAQKESSSDGFFMILIEDFDRSQNVMDDYLFTRTTYLF